MPRPCLVAHRRALGALAVVVVLGCRGSTDERRVVGARDRSGIAGELADAQVDSATAARLGDRAAAQLARDGGLDASNYERAFGRRQTPSNFVGIYARDARFKMEDALLLLLRSRQLIAQGVVENMNPAPLIAKTDRQIKWLLAALCGPVVEYDGGVLDVMAEPVERLFPLELLDRAVGAGCMGLAVDDSFMEGPAARELRRARPPATK